MKICPICNQTYLDEKLNFCLNDGGVLHLQEDNSPPTMVMNQPRATNPNWSNYQPPTYENQQLTPNSTWGMQGQAQFPAHGRDQTLPTISLIISVLGIFFMCCYGGIIFGIPALILGYLGMQNANNNPQFYSGREMAIAGMLIGGVSLFLTVLLIILGVIGNLF